MSAPNHYIRDAEHINYGFLSVRAVEVFKKLKNKQTLSAEDNDILNRVVTFLSQIADGAELISAGSYQGCNAMASMDALNLAMGPLERLQDLIEDKDISAFFRQLFKDVQLLVSAKSKISTKNQKLLDTVIMFFEALSLSLLETIGSGKPRLGGTHDNAARVHEQLR